ncbi:FMN-binding protein [Vagococcus coleopterorum]|uniref:FMN-binding protein n=1 Tax=Vagococcus coleopterorum TaxID=2714946 RepID=A0A6G8ALP1_9ENTE|nr:extracellular electron transfer flavoprotein PplA [Vagococcus coleopterorum]QIL45978.1 FMN-binding protein [Vagococcus coleopterorum]
MKAKKFLTGFSVLMMASLVMVACTPDKKEETKEEAKTEQVKVAGAELQDGTYTLEEAQEANGYKATFTMVVKDGKIAEGTVYDNVNAEGKSKKEDADYNKKMLEFGGDVTNPEAFIPALNESLLETGSADGVEVVTGATHSSMSFKNYAQQLVQAAQAGNTEKIVIENGKDLQDGEYKLEEKNDSNGYHTVFSIVVKDGKLVESKYDNVNAEGKSKQEDAEYNKNMLEFGGDVTNPEKFIPELNKKLVEANETAAKEATEEKPYAATAGIDVVTGATHSSHSFEMYAEQLINAAQKGNTDTIVVDNIVMEDK